MPFLKVLRKFTYRHRGQHIIARPGQVINAQHRDLANRLLAQGFCVPRELPAHKGAPAQPADPWPTSGDLVSLVNFGAWAIVECTAICDV